MEELTRELKEDEEITGFEEVKWKTFLSRRIDRFSSVISNPTNFEKYFGEKYIEKISSKSRTITQITLKLGVVYFVLILSLFVSQNSNNPEFEIFGFGFENLSNYKELILFLVAIVSPISAVLTAYNRYLTALIKECLMKISPDKNVREFYSHLFLDEYFDGLISNVSEEDKTWHGFTVFIVVTFAFIFLLLLVALMIATFFIQISVIYEVAMTPSSSEYVSLFVVTFAIASIIFVWLVNLLRLPMPVVDYGNYTKISRTEQEDPDRYRRIMKTLLVKRSKKDTRYYLFFSATVYCSVYLTVTMCFFSENFENISYLLETAIPGAILVMFLSSKTASIIDKRGWNWFFKEYPEDSPQRLALFTGYRKKLLLGKTSAFIVLSLMYVIVALFTT